MKHYVGIDLGTTNSAITSFDGESTRLYKSPETNDVTPSAIFVDRRGARFYGKPAYDGAARNPGNAAVRFKRLMGTSTPVKLTAVDLVMTPEECSAEILRVLFGYLPEEVRNDPDTGTVITVPAAFNQMQKDATSSAAEAAGLGRVALMQEPVAAVMSVMHHRRGDGMFLVYDLGGGTLDIAIAESTKGRVSVLAHGGIAMCGGRDFDRLLFHNVVKSWLLDNFDLPGEISVDRQYAALHSMAIWATERAKIELSSRDEAVVSLDESDLRAKDGSGQDIFLDVPVARSVYDALIADEIANSLSAARETMEKAGVTGGDIGRIVFVGGPTNYAPLRDKVAAELGIAASTEVNPMTAVSEGAAIFAESIDWSSQSRGRKSGRGEIASEGGLKVSFAYVSRTPSAQARIVAKVGGQALEGAAFQIESLDTGWSSGRIELREGASIDVTLSKPGENIFKLWVFDAAGGPISLPQDRITIARTSAQIDGIPASHSIGVEAREKLGGRFVSHFLVRAGDPLPKKGKLTFKSDETLHAGDPSSIKFKLWEGEIDHPAQDNRFIGMFEVFGSDFSDGVIAKGSDLIVDYEILDSGTVTLEVTVPSIGGAFNSGRNFYSRQAGQIDYSDVAKRVADETEQVGSRIDEMAREVDDPRLDQARQQLEEAASGAIVGADPETAKKASDSIQKAKELLAAARKANLHTTRRMQLDSCVSYFDSAVRKHARPAEATAFDKLASTARGVIGKDSGDFESHLRDLKGKNWQVLWRQDWFVIDHFKWLAVASHQFPNKTEYSELIRAGRQAMEADDTDRLRQVITALESSRVAVGGEDQIMAPANIVVGSAYG